MLLEHTEESAVHYHCCRRSSFTGHLQLTVALNMSEEEPASQPPVPRAAQAALIAKYRPHAIPAEFEERVFHRLVSDDVKRMRAIVAALLAVDFSRTTTLNLYGFYPNPTEIDVLLSALASMGPAGPRELKCVPGVDVHCSRVWVGVTRVPCQPPATHNCLRVVLLLPVKAGVRRAAPAVPVNVPVCVVVRLVGVTACAPWALGSRGAASVRAAFGTTAATASRRG